ncbi:uncharacterized protein K452DRAFT_311781 [Aplosporella prunicola CBS 121167]|uniref:Aquaporin-like protein n=1 Tax=Aplosporella prunicola CBS 121167 TaxID=1176127 RepID=A0A6A6B451_9PEZI|nr:uncharacterized protein K452DRAFT_311781 [Aplosporella prunicola CBS 121167]KAF2137994.1 hypothetical protein K452DRAFT_311781 [Aplosporella prunicola CBS 121167]
MPPSQDHGDQQGLLTTNSGSNANNTPQVSDTDLSSRRIPSDDSNTSDADFQKLLSSRQLGSGRASQDTSNRPKSAAEKASENKDRIAELRAELDANQKQIQQLGDAQRAVHDAVQGITATQELLHVAPEPPNLGRNPSYRTEASARSQEKDDRPEEPVKRPSGARFQGDTPDAYYKLNPWYGQPKRKPVFGLGQPLPHTIRVLNPVDGEASKKPSAEKDPEKGEGGQDPEKAKGKHDTEKAKGKQNPEKVKDKQNFSLGETLPHQRDGQPVSHHDPSYSLGKDFPHNNGKPGGGKKQGKAPRKATVETPEETEKREQQEEVLPYENQAAANPTGTEGRAPLDSDGRPEKLFDPFADFDEIGNIAIPEQDNTKWAIDAEPIGQAEKDEAEEGEVDPDELRNWWARIRAKHPEPLAEFLCTVVSIFLGMCATLQVNLTNGQYGNYETSCWAWGISFMLGIYIGGGVSGAHMNPAISYSLWLFRGFPVKQASIYFVAQILGCIVASALAYAIFHDVIHYMDPGLVDTATYFYSKPQDYVSPATAFFTQFLAAAIMMMSVLALGDDQNNPPGAGLHSFIMGLVQTMQKMTLGMNTGVALNPASDFGPRLVCLMVGYNTNMFTEVGLWWLWGPWVSTACGSVVGCAVYDSFVFVGSESPINYRLPEKYRNRLKKALPASKRD